MAMLLEKMICVSEKAANLARACRSDEKLFELLVEEKTGETKNAKFVQDFKTLANVLIQETVRHDLSKTFPELYEHVRPWFEKAEAMELVNTMELIGIDKKNERL